MENNKEFFAGKLEDVGGYQAYIPNKINHDFSVKDNKTLKLLETASVALGRLDALFPHIEFTNLYTNMLVHLEALSSNAIEGTKIDNENIKDVLSKDDKNENTDVQKIKNLFNTTDKYYNNPKKAALDVCSVEEIEKINRFLFAYIKPVSKDAGKIRKVQNYIGGKNVLSALYVPPPPKCVEELMKDLNDFWHNSSFYIPTLIKIALYHFQFESIHPFNDGNGRTGRLLINLQLKNTGLLNLPVLCLSDYWKRNRGLYYEALTTARFSRNSEDVEYWIRFFLQSIITTCEERIETILKLFDIKERYEKLLLKSCKQPSKHMALLEYLLSQTPFITVKEAENLLKITYQGANKIIDNFVSMGILYEINSSKRNRLFLFKECHDLVFKDFEESNESNS